ncbi:MAG TPA: GNAT family N-acetyltransferase [Blastocatellia bacterium]|nr:GNAT family N-acetyltransferase [Blastocatellia bacterium]
MSSNEIIIRRAVDGDLEAAHKLLAELGYPNLDRDEFATTFNAVLHHNEMVLLVAVEPSGRVVGLTSISHRPQLRLAGTFVTIDEFVVSSEARGLGVGRKMLEEAKRVAESLNARRLELEQNRARESYKRGFYFKNGFVEADSAVLRLKEDSAGKK